MHQFINLDMDHVVADFDRHFINTTGRPYDTTKSAEMFSLLKDEGKGFFLNIPPYQGAKEFVDEIKEIARFYDYIVRFLTAKPYLYDIPTAHEEKKLWTKHHLCEHSEVLIGPYARDKWRHAKKGDILIDDQLLNINQWIEAGGIGIQHFDFNQSLTILKSILENKKC